MNASEINLSGGIFLSAGHRRLHARVLAAWWMLLAAWVCVNSPHLALYAIVDWCSEARHFTHQQRLVADVSALLQRTTPRSEVPVKFAAAAKSPESAPRPWPPVDGLVKKLNFSPQGCAVPGPANERENALVAWSIRCPAARVLAPPHEPPRAG